MQRSAGRVRSRRHDIHSSAHDGFAASGWGGNALAATHAAAAATGGETEFGSDEQAIVAATALRTRQKQQHAEWSQ